MNFTNLEKIELAIRYEDLLQSHTIYRMGFDNYFKFRENVSFDFELYSSFQFILCEHAQIWFDVSTSPIQPDAVYIYIGLSDSSNLLFARNISRSAL